MDQQVQTLIQSTQHLTGWQLFFGFLIVLVGYSLNRILLRLSSFFFKQQISWINKLRYWIPITRITIWMLVVYSVVSVISPPRELLFALLTSAGVAIGLAAQGLVKDVFGALVLWTDQVYSEGDRVTINEVEGIVKTIGLRSTRVWAFDDTIITVPNSELLSTSVYNANSGANPEQVVVDLLLPLHADTDLAVQLARTAAISTEYLDTSFPVVVHVADQVGTPPMSRIRIKAYVRGVAYEKALMSEICDLAKKAFREAGLYGNQPPTNSC